MLKRANKVAALLVAASSILSLVPAMAADTTTQKLNTTDGTIESAVAFSDGKYVYQGYKSDDDDNSIYYNDGSKDKELDDIQDADIQGAYANKYAFAEDGSDQYLVDLTNGSVTDDTTPDDDLDTAETKLRTNLKKTDRYGQIDANAVSLARIEKGPKFGDTWYSYTATPISTADGKDYTLNNQLFGFTNQTGKYIDISTTANIYAYSATKGKVVKIEDFTNDYTDVDSDTKLSATLAAAPQVLTQDKDNFYVKVSVNVYDAAATTQVGTTTSAAAVFGDASANVLTTHTYIQKISKAQGDQKDDAYLPKTVTSYEVTKGILDSGDADDAYDAINAADDFSVVNGQLLAIVNSGDNVKVTSIDLKKDKVNFEGSNKPTSSKVDVYLAEKNDSDDVDVDGDKSYDIDVDGNVWVVADGKIYEFKNNEMTKIYTCDSSLDSLSVYDANNLIAWEEDGDIYSTVSGTSSTDPTTPVDPAKTGWDKLADGTWNFYDSTGTKVVNQWVNDGGVWYYLKADGVMATGWVNDNGTWYFLKSSGAMATGWVNDNGTWYFLNASGAMATGWVNDSGTWYFLKSSGAMATGWVNDNGTWYYLNSSGAMLANTVVDGYVLGASGAWIR